MTKITAAVEPFHSVITLTPKRLDKQPFGTTYWKLNSGSLGDASYVDVIRTKYYEWVKEFPWNMSVG